MVTAELARRLGVGAQILPMSNQKIRTVIISGEERLPFQTYFVRRGCQPPVDDIHFSGIKQALPAPGVLQAILEANIVLLGPSNPFVSIGTILAVPGIREALKSTAGKVVAVSPIVNGKALKGPAARMLRGRGMEVSPASVCRLYEDFLDLFIADIQDEACRDSLEATGVPFSFCDTVMTAETDRVRMAAEVLKLCL